VEPFYPPGNRGAEPAREEESMSTPLRERPDAPLGTLIFRAGLLPAETIESALEEGVKTGKRLGEILTERGLLNETDLARLLAGQKGLEFVTLREQIVDPAAAALFTLEQARLFRAVPYAFDESAPVVAIADPTDAVLTRNIREALGRENLRFVVSTRAELTELVEDVYSNPLTAPQPATPEPTLRAPEPPAVETGLLGEYESEAMASEPDPVSRPEPEPAPAFGLATSPEPEHGDPANGAAPSDPFPAPVVNPVLTAGLNGHGSDAEDVLRPQPALLVPEPSPGEASPAEAPAFVQGDDSPPLADGPPPGGLVGAPEVPRGLELVPDLAAGPVETAPEPAAAPAGEADVLDQSATFPAPTEGPTAETIPFPHPLPAPPPAPYPPAAAQPAPAETGRQNAIPATYRVTVSLAHGERVEAGVFQDLDLATRQAKSLMLQMATADRGDWPFVAGRFLKPDTIVSVDIAEDAGDGSGS
jgi:Type II secretion system (T2SS), protein E, N-terminal domain